MLVWQCVVKPNFYLRMIHNYLSFFYSPMARDSKGVRYGVSEKKNKTIKKESKKTWRWKKKSDGSTKTGRNDEEEDGYVVRRE